MSAPAPVLAAHGLALRLGGRTILHQVDVAVRPGEQVGLLGANGSGKTSVLKALLGLAPACADAVAIDGAPAKLGGQSLRGLCGVVLQSGSLDHKLSARENLQLAGRLQGLFGARLRQAVDQAIEDFGYPTRADERVERISGGMMRRLELARALMHRPRVLLLDEPTAGLDAEARERFWQQVAARRNADGLAVLVCTHDAQEAARCQTLVVLHDGRVHSVSTPEALLARIEREVLCFECDNAEQVAATLRPRFGAAITVLANRVELACASGHVLIPPLVEAIGAERLRSVSLRRASLADAFLQLTGAPLGRAPNTVDHAA